MDNYGSFKGALAISLIDAMRDLNSDRSVNGEYLRGQIELALQMLGYEDDGYGERLELERLIVHDRIDDEHEQTTPGPTCDRHGGPWGSDETCENCTDEDGIVLPTPRPVYGFFDFEEDQSTDQIPGKYVLEIVKLEYDERGEITGGEEIAVIAHRTENGMFPIDGEVAETKRNDAQLIVDALNAYHAQTGEGPRG